MGRTLWRGGSFNPVLIGVAMVTAAVLIAFVRQGEGPTAGWIFTGLIVAIVLPFSWVHCDLDEERLKISIGPWGVVPILSIPTASIRGIEIISVSPLREYGGWGLRYGGSAREGRGWAVIVRAGEAIAIQRADKKPFVVTVDDPGGAVPAYRELIV